MKLHKFAPLLLIFPLLVSCNSEEHEFYSKYDFDFGIVKNVTPYEIKDTVTIKDNVEAFKFHGRHYFNSTINAEFFGFSNSGFEVSFYGTSLEGCFYATKADDNDNRPYIAVSIDNDYDPDKAIPIQLTTKTNSNSDGYEGGFSRHSKIVLAHDLPLGNHTVRIYKRSECNNSKVAIKSVSCDGNIDRVVKSKNLNLKLEFFGDSVTCGYAVESDDFYENFSTRTENATKSFANYCANYLNADVSLVSAGGYPMYKSAYSEGCTPDNIPDMFSLASIDWNTNPLIQWDNSRYVPDVVVIALGANDGSYLEQHKNVTDLVVGKYKTKYIGFLDKIFETYPDCVVVVSDEILTIDEHYENEMDEIVESYNSSHTLKHNLIRMKYNAFNLSKDKTLPGAGHPNQTMQHIAGKELANKLSQEFDYQIFDDDFTY